MVFDKYIKINEKPIAVAQDPKTGAWYCKDLKADGTKELDELMGETITIMNRYNTGENEKKTPVPPKKEKKPMNIEPHVITSKME